MRSSVRGIAAKERTGLCVLGVLPFPNQVKFSLFICLFFKAGFLCVALGVLDHPGKTRLLLNSRDLPASDSEMMGLKATEALWETHNFKD